ncbi:MAG TPA: ABC transporter ATP-binding protein [Polyangia bacterium]|jgi:putative ABC transport system ATP-binding protein|nr:ABC transporter ATP-binding protein [Polyangia bacterium]
MNPIVELRKVGKRYGAGANAVQALVDADVAVHAGEVLLIQGPSGSGKTTLLSILGLLLRPTSGDVVVDGQVATGLPERALPAIRARHFGFVFQGFNLFAALTALENVALATQMKHPKARDTVEEARRLLAAVGLGDRMHHRPEELSGGQKQRVAIARALGGGPPVILGDEPTAAVDSKTALGIMELLHGLARNEGRAVVVVTHDHRLERYADRVVGVEDGHVSGGHRSGAPS